MDGRDDGFASELSQHQECPDPAQGILLVTQFICDELQARLAVGLGDPHQDLKEHGVGIRKKGEQGGQDPHVPDGKERCGNILGNVGIVGESLERVHHRRHGVGISNGRQNAQEKPGFPHACNPLQAVHIF
ncbi:MAG: hypothetical protein ACYTFG_21360, partial [Planctomycetota bacterium]